MNIKDICETIESYGFTVVDMIDQIDGTQVPCLPATSVELLIREARARTLESEAALVKGLRGRIMNERAILIREGRS